MFPPVAAGPGQWTGAAWSARAHSIEAEADPTTGSMRVLPQRGQNNTGP
jgi:hypothetical protein